MRKERVLCIMTLCLLLWGGYHFMYPHAAKPSNEKPNLAANAPPTEQFIYNELLLNDGSIATDLIGNARHEEALSESIGLWMEYLVEKDVPAQFDAAYNTVISEFLTEKGLLTWRITDGKKATTNALIDDLRVIAALFQKGEQTGEASYIETAMKMSEAVIMYNRNEDMFVDFYDEASAAQSDILTLSYLKSDALRYMRSYQLLSDKAYADVLALMESLPQKNGFYPKQVHVDGTFDYDQIINLVDQLYLTLHLEKADIATDAFYEWLKAAFYEENQLYGRYDATTKKPAVTYEAASVYALAILYSTEKNDTSFAIDLFTKMVEMQDTGEASSYYGGYVDPVEKSTHPFDNLLPLLAERKLKQCIKYE